MQLSDTIMNVLYEVRFKYKSRITTDAKGIELMVECERPALRVTQRIDYDELPKYVERRETALMYVMKQMILKLDDMVEQSFKENK